MTEAPHPSAVPGLPRRFHSLTFHLVSLSLSSLLCRTESQEPTDFLGGPTPHTEADNGQLLGQAPEKQKSNADGFNADVRLDQKPQGAGWNPKAHGGSPEAGQRRLQGAGLGYKGVPALSI